MQAMADGSIAPRETVNLLAVVAAAARVAERVQSMKERHPACWGGGLHDTARAALGAVLREHGFDDAFLYSPVNSDAADADPKQSPANAAKHATYEEASDKAPAAVTESKKEREGLYFPVNSNASAPKPAPRSANRTDAAPAELPPAPALDAAVRAHVDALRAHASGNRLGRRRRAPMESVSPAALRLGGLPVNSRSYNTDQSWPASLKETGPHHATKRKAA
jgi:hypothetical protein